MRIYYNNNIEDTILTASSNSGDYSVDDLKIPQLSRKYVFASNDDWIVMSFTSATNIKSFIVDIGNLSSSATITLEGNATNVWTSPTYSQVMTITETCAYLDLDETYQYFRLILNDSTVSEISIGYLFIDSGYLQMPGISASSDLYYTDTSASSISISGQVYGDAGYQFMETSFDFPQISEDATTIMGLSVATRKEILSFWETVKNYTPFWVFLWENNLDEIAPLFCVYYDSRIKFKKLKYGKYYSTSISLREVK